MATASPCGTAGSVRFRILFPKFFPGVEPPRWKSVCPILSLNQGAHFAGGGGKISGYLRRPVEADMQARLGI